MIALLLALTTPDIGSAIAAAVNPCPTAPRSGEIMVCGRTKEENDRRFRLPPDDRGFDPLGSVDSVSRERNRLIDGDGEYGPDARLVQPGRRQRRDRLHDQDMARA